MTYATKQDLIDRFSERELVLATDDAKPAATIDDTKVARALTDTDALINSYIAARYATPVTRVPSSLNDRACAIARYKLARDKASERITNDYNDAIKWLGQIATGTVTLADAVAAPTEQSAGGGVKGAGILAALRRGRPGAGLPGDDRKARRKKLRAVARALMGERADDGEALYADLRLWGTPEAEIDRLKAEHRSHAQQSVVEIEPENRDAFRVFLRVMSQWRGQPIVAGTKLIFLRSGLEYATLPVVAQALGLVLDEELLDAVRVMEAEALLVHTQRQQDHLTSR